MRVTIRQKNLTLTPALTHYVEDKLLRPLRRRLKENISEKLPILDLELGRISRHHRKGKVYKATANLSIGRKLLHVEVEDSDIRTACLSLEQGLDQEIRTYKGRRDALARRHSRAAKKELRYHSAARLYRKGRIRREGN